jgi:LmbE family N-acetylglucosaminyl deacetylase
MPTLMAVHAHPDDEGIQTGGVLALAAQRGFKTVLVTCTNGEMGDSPDGLKPESDGHDTASTAELRLRELRKACEALSIADVVITYDGNGLYGHPDHIQAHRATIGAAEKTGIPQKIYEIAFPLSLMKAFAEMQRQAGVEQPTIEEDAGTMGTLDELITTTIDVSSVWDAKKASIFAHQSQMANFDFLKMDEELIRGAFGTEHFVRRFDRTGAPVPENDLFAGISSVTSSSAPR